MRGGTTDEKPWLTSSLLNSCKRQNKLYKISLILKTDEAVAKYKAYKITLNHLLRISERKYYYDKFESVTGNLGSTWKLIKKVLNKGKLSNAPSEFKIGNKMSKDGSEIVDAYNNFLLILVLIWQIKLSPNQMLTPLCISNI